MIPKIAASLKPGAAAFLIVAAGIVLGQFALYGPSLSGRTVLLPLEILDSPDIYADTSRSAGAARPRDFTRADLVLQWEPARRFARSELRAGRLPMWMPYQYAGVPVVWPKFSPLMLLECCTASPVILAWVQLLAALIAGGGTYLFCRHALSLGFWACAFAAWSFPLVGFLVFWQGYPTCAPVYWLPWQVLLVDRTVRSRRPLVAVGLSLTTGLVLTSGALDVGGQVVLTSGLYALWCLFDEHRKRRLAARRVLAAVFAVSAGWTLGFALAAPYWLPLLEYARTGQRMELRQAGAEERPPEGISALPPLILPDIYGTSRIGSYRIGKQPQIESSSTAYAGLLASLVLAPLAWCSRRHRSVNVFWLLLIIASLGWCLNIPGLVQVLRWPGLNSMSHNRLVFAASFAVIAMTATGLNELLTAATIQPRRWFWLPVGVLTAVFLFSAYRCVWLPEPIATILGSNVQAGRFSGRVRGWEDVGAIQDWFVWHSAVPAVLSLVALAAWLALWKPACRSACLPPLLCALSLCDVLWFASNRSEQCSPSSYYQPLPVLEAFSGPYTGRMVACDYLPAALAQTHGVYDVRGYDAVDPKRFMELMDIAADPRSPRPRYARTQFFLPRCTLAAPDGVRLSPVLDLLGVRYVIFRGDPPEGFQAVYREPGYWMVVNHSALPRAFVPRRVQVAADREERLRALASAQFDAREVCYVEQPVDVPALCGGRAEVTRETPTRMTVAATMATTGLVVLSDLWDVGWKAYIDGRPAPIVIADHALRGVKVHAGGATLEFRYEPESFRLGSYASAASAGIIFVVAVTTLLVRLHRKPELPPHTAWQNGRGLLRSFPGMYTAFQDD